MTFDLYADVSSLAVIFAHSLIGSLEHVLLWCLFLSFFYVVLIYNTLGLTSQINLRKKIMMNLDLNPGQLVRLVRY